MADTRNRLWAGLAVGLLAALGVLATGILGDDGDQTATNGAGQDASQLGDGSTDDSPLALADPGATPDGATDRRPALLVVAPEHLGADAASATPATSTAPSTSTSTSTSSSTSNGATPATADSAPATVKPEQPEVTTSENQAGDPSSTTGSDTPATTAATMAPSTAPPADPPTTLAPSSGGGGFEQQVIELTNAERRKAGCPDLTNNAKLHAAALAHSTDMATKGYFSHTGANGSSMQDRVEAQGYSWRSLAENIAAGYRSAEAVVTGWMNSSGHRANILNCGLTEIGVGFHDYHWTQNFGTPR